MWRKTAKLIIKIWCQKFFILNYTLCNMRAQRKMLLTEELTLEQSVQWVV